ncbi:MAG: hypothetical protein U0528_07830 [Anaerolineae bacterium]
MPVVGTERRGSTRWASSRGGSDAGWCSALTQHSARHVSWQSGIRRVVMGGRQDRWRFRPEGYLHKNPDDGFAIHDGARNPDWHRGMGRGKEAGYRPARAAVLLTNQVCNACSDYNVTFGDPGDQPFTGDWNGDGRTGLGVYRTSNGLTYLRNDPTTTGFSDFNFVYGINGDYAFGGVWVAVGGGSSQIEIAPTFQP